MAVVWNMNIRHWNISLIYALVACMFIFPWRWRGCLWCVFEEFRAQQEIQEFLKIYDLRTMDVEILIQKYSVISSAPNSSELRIPYAIFKKGVAGKEWGQNNNIKNI